MTQNFPSNKESVISLILVKFRIHILLVLTLKKNKLNNYFFNFEILTSKIKYFSIIFNSYCNFAVRCHMLATNFIVLFCYHQSHGYFVYFRQLTEVILEEKCIKQLFGYANPNANRSITFVVNLMMMIIKIKMIMILFQAINRRYIRRERY